MQSMSAIEQVFEFRRSRLEQAYETLKRPRFQRKLANRITKPTYFLIDGYSFEYPADLPLDISQRNDWAISHKSDCHLFVSPLDGLGSYEFEADESFYKVASMAAEKIWTESHLAKDLVDTHQGLWVTALEVIWRRIKDKPFVGTKPALTPKFELLLPGFEAWLDWELHYVRPIVVEKNRLGYSERQKSESAHFIRSKVMEMALSYISDKQQTCQHNLSVECLVCERELEPDLRASVEWRFPKNLCVRCVTIFDYHRRDLMEVGLDGDLARTAQIEAVQLLNPFTDNQLWELLPSSSHLYYVLDVASRPGIEQVQLLKSLAALAVNDLWETKYHLLAAAGLEELLPRGKSRGIRSVSSCGHLCLSEGERTICEELMRRGVPHGREPVYWKISGLNPSEGRSVFGEMRGDYIIGRTILEYAGLHGHAEYDQKMQTKLRLCSEHGIEMKVVYPDDLRLLPQKLDELGIPAKRR